MKVGIEALNVYPGRAFLDVRKLLHARELNVERFENLLMKSKTVSLNFEDPVSFAVNAAKPLVDALSEEEKRRIELVIVATESGIDYGKAMSTYVHHYLGLSRSCRTFELKHACYAGTAALQMAASFVLSQASPGAKALVVTTDVARPIPHTYAEPSQGAAAVAMLVGGAPVVLELEIGASGYYGYEVMDSCRPTAEIETGDADLSLLSYLDCLENSFKNYQQRTGDADFQDHFGYLAFHTPFGGMAKGAHRTMMRKLKRLQPAAIDEDFRKRVQPSLTYCQQVGNVYSGTVFVALAGTLDKGSFDDVTRIGLFSYGSGCCSEFFSGLAFGTSQAAVARLQISCQIDTRYALTMEEYDQLLDLNRSLMTGKMSQSIDREPMGHIFRSSVQGRGLLTLKDISGYHRVYEWV